MLRLREQVGGDPSGISTAIRDKEDLARTRQQIYGNRAEDLSFGFDDVGVPLGKIRVAVAENLHEERVVSTGSKSREGIRRI